MKLEDLGVLLERNGFYEGTIVVPWYGQSTSAKIGFDKDDETDSPTAEQIQALSQFIEERFAIFERLEQQLLEYYQSARAEAQHCYEADYFAAHYPEISDKAHLERHVRLKSVLVGHYMSGPDSYIGLVIDCDWDQELGVGVKLVHNAVSEIGVQDIAF